MVARVLLLLKLTTLGAMKVVQALQPNADVRKGMAIAGDPFDEVRDDVIQFVQGLQY